jgi:serine/threonine protein kinase
MQALAIFEISLYWMHRWAFGVLIYEMLAGYPPFYDDGQVDLFDVSV